MITAETNDLGTLLHEVLRLDGVITSCDYYLGRAARLTAHLGLPGVQPEAIECSYRKDLARWRMREAGLPGPAFEVAEDWPAVRDAADGLGFPLVIKRVDLRAGMFHRDPTPGCRRGEAVEPLPDRRRPAAEPDGAGMRIGWRTYPLRPREPLRISRSTMPGRDAVQVGLSHDGVTGHGEVVTSVHYGLDLTTILTILARLRDPVRRHGEPETLLADLPAPAPRLPAQPVVVSGATVLGDWRAGFADRRFLAFSVALAGMFALQTQLHLVLPVQAEHVTGRPVAVAALFVVSTVVTLALQLPLTGWLQGRRCRGARIVLGLAVTGAAFLLPLVHVEAVSPALRLVPVLAAAVLLTLGVMIAQPFVLELIPTFAGPGRTGTYFGLFYLVSGVVAAGCTAAVGAAVDTSAGAGVPATAWLLTAGVGVASAAGVGLLLHGGLLEPVPASQAAGVA